MSWWDTVIHLCSLSWDPSESESFSAGEFTCFVSEMIYVSLCFPLTAYLAQFFLCCTVLELFLSCFVLVSPFLFDFFSCYFQWLIRSLFKVLFGQEHITNPFFNFLGTVIR